MRINTTALCWTLVVSSAAASEPRTMEAASDRRVYPRLVTAQTRADPEALAALEKPGKVFFRDDFESPGSLKKYFEIRGLKDGRAELVIGVKLAHSGKGHWFRFSRGSD